MASATIHEVSVFTYDDCAVYSKMLDVDSSAGYLQVHAVSFMVYSEGREVLLRIASEALQLHARLEAAAKVAASEPSPTLPPLEPMLDDDIPF